MTNAETIIKLQRLIETFNPKQQQIAMNLVSDSRYDIFEVSILGKNKFHIKIQDDVYNFKDYVMSKCNC